MRLLDVAMNEKQILRSIAIILVALSTIIIVFLRVAGIDLTEGQLLVTFWPWWVTVLAVDAVAILILRKCGDI